jgi:hypothetical protein
MTPKKDPNLKKFSLLTKRIDRCCDRDWWNTLSNNYQKQDVIDCLFPEVKNALIEREKQLFEYLGIPYTEIKDNSIHYVMRELADRANIPGFKYKEFKPCELGRWDTSFGEKFVLQVLQIHLSQNKSILNSIKYLVENNPTYKPYKRKDKSKQDGIVDGISKRFFELLRNKKYIKEFYDECNRTPKNELNDRLKQIDTWLQQYPGEN